MGWEIVDEEYEKITASEARVQRVVWSFFQQNWSNLTLKISQNPLFKARYDYFYRISCIGFVNSCNTSIDLWDLMDGTFILYMLRILGYLFVSKMQLYILILCEIVTKHTSFICFLHWWLRTWEKEVMKKWFRYVINPMTNFQRDWLIILPI